MSREYVITVLPGDGIGPEVVEQATAVMEAVGSKYNIRFVFRKALIGGAAIDTVGVPLPEETLTLCRKSDAVLLGATGGEKWDNLPGSKRPEAALLDLRKQLKVYANLRPSRVYTSLLELSPLAPDKVRGLDILVVRELTGGIYFGPKGRKDLPGGEYEAYDTNIYSSGEIRRVARRAFAAAASRSKRVTCVDKANIMETSRLWRQVVGEVGKEYPDIKIDYMYVDNCAMQIILNPRQFDVILTENTFGDILSDELSVIPGSIGMAPSASLGETGNGIYEGIHGSAPDIAGKNSANPLATILSAAMMLRFSLRAEKAAADIEAAVEKALSEGCRTRDLCRSGEDAIGTAEMGKEIIARL